MIHGMDTGFLVALELIEHADYLAARQTLTKLITASDRIAFVPQVLTEFIHVATDHRRFKTPLDMASAIRAAEQWWSSSDVIQMIPNDDAVTLLLHWVRQYSLGRKRLLDTLFAATLHESGVVSILTTNPVDFAIFGVFTCITPGQ